MHISSQNFIRNITLSPIIKYPYTRSYFETTATSSMPLLTPLSLLDNYVQFFGSPVYLKMKN